MEKRILFVGDQQPLWREFQTYSAEQASGWTAEFAGTGRSALGLIEQSSFDAVLVDVRLSGTNGVDLLDTIMRRQPKALRLILSDVEDARSTVKCVGRAHQHLVTPCSASMILEALDQAGARESWLPSDVVRALIARMWWVPSPPSIYAQILAEANSPDASVDKVGTLIAQDPAVTAKILQLANSVMFGLRLQVTRPVEAVTHVGLETTKALVLLAHTFSSFEPLNKAGFSAEALWRHSVMTGQFARRIATMEQGNTELAEEAFAAGLLHDIGKLLFAANLPESFGQALALTRTRSCPMWEAESEIFGASHAEVGACVLGVWGLPMPLVQAVAAHHRPGDAVPETVEAVPAEPVFTSITAVHAANVFEHEVGMTQTAEAPPTLDLAYLEGLGLAQRIEEWRSDCLARGEAALG